MQTKKQRAAFVAEYSKSEIGKLDNEEFRAEQEKRRSGMPGAIRRSDHLGVWWTRKRYDVADNNFALFRSPELD